VASGGGLPESEAGDSAPGSALRFVNVGQTLKGGHLWGRTRQSMQ
jgi:hypothetical protein